MQWKNSSIESKIEYRCLFTPCLKETLIILSQKKTVTFEGKTPIVFSVRNSCCRSSFSALLLLKVNTALFSREGGREEKTTTEIESGKTFFPPHLKCFFPLLSFFHPRPQIEWTLGVSFCVNRSNSSVCLSSRFGFIGRNKRNGSFFILSPENLPLIFFLADVERDCVDGGTRQNQTKTNSDDHRVLIFFHLAPMSD